MHAYQPKGKRSYSIRLPEPATCLEALELRRTPPATPPRSSAIPVPLLTSTPPPPQPPRPLPL